jgi:hypothetical protein
MKSTASTPPTTPICPKCGYDQSGEIATWETKCPLEGRCPECGVVLSWGVLFEPMIHDLGWYAEHARSVGQMAKRTVSTVRMLLIPSRYWDRVGLGSRVRTGRLIAWLIFFFLGIHLLTSAMEMVYEIEDYRSIGASGLPVGVQDWVGFIADGLCWPINAPDWQRIDYFTGSSAFQSIYGWNPRYDLMYPHDLGVTGLVRSLALLGSVGIWVIILLATRQTRKRDGIRMIHVFRVLMISAFASALLFELGRVMESAIQIAYVQRWSIRDRLRYDLGPMVFQAASIGLLVWIQWFWITAIRSQWPVPSSRVLSTLGTLASLLASVSIYILVVSTR